MLTDICTTLDSRDTEMNQVEANVIQRRLCGVDLLPVCFVALMFMSIAISFTIAVAQSDITPWFPAISDTATKSPESNIFGQLVNIASFLGFLLVYVRYLQVKRDVEFLEGSRSTMKLNNVSLFFGLIAILGGSLVANFPETQVGIVHDTGALMMFVCGNIYAWIQVVISFYMQKYGMVSACISSTRVIFSLVSTVSLIVCMVMLYKAYDKWSGDKLHWNSSDPGYKEHVISDAFEWLMVFSFLLMFLTFTKEFCQHRLQIKLVDYQDYEPISSQTRYVEVL